MEDLACCGNLCLNTNGLATLTAAKDCIIGQCKLNCILQQELQPKNGITLGCPMSGIPLLRTPAGLLIQLSFQFQCIAHYTGHLILAQRG